MRKFICLIILLCVSVCQADSKKNTVLVDRYGKRTGTITESKGRYSFSDQYGRTKGTLDKDRYGSRAGTNKSAVRSSYENRYGGRNGSSKISNGDVVISNKYGQREAMIKKDGTTLDRYGFRTGARNND